MASDGDRPNSLFTLILEEQPPEAIGAALTGGSGINDVDFRRRTVLHIAAEKGLADHLKELVAVPGVQVNAVDDKQRTALHYATTAQAAAILIEAGATLDATDKDGLTALHLASSPANQSLLALLVEAGARLDVRDRHGRYATDNFDGLRDLPSWLVDSLVETFINADLGSQDLIKALTKLRTLVHNDENHLNVVDRLIQAADARTRIIQLFQKGSTEVVAAFVQVILQMFRHTRSRDLLFRSNTFTLWSEAFDGAPAASQVRLISGLISMAETSDGDAWRRIVAAMSPTIVRLLTTSELSSPVVLEALHLLVRASRFPAAHTEMISSRLLKSIMPLVRPATVKQHWDAVYGLLQIISNLAENVDSHEQLVGLHPWETLVIPLGLSDEIDVIKGLSSVTIPQALRFEALRGLVLLGLEEYVYVVDPTMFNLFDDGMLPYFEPLVFDAERVHPVEGSAAMSPLTPDASSNSIASPAHASSSSGSIAESPTEVEPKFLQLPRAMDRWWSSSTMLGRGTVGERGSGGADRLTAAPSSTNLVATRGHHYHIRKGIPRAGSLVSLVRYLVLAPSDTQYIEHFLFSYRTFVSPIVFMRLLVHLAASHMKGTGEMPVGTLAMVVLEMLVKNHGRDITESSKMVEFVRQFIHKRTLHNPSNVERALATLITDLLNNPHSLDVKGATGDKGAVPTCAHEALYIKARDQILRSMMPTKEDEAMQLAALQFRIETAQRDDLNEEIVILQEIESNLKKIVPVEFLLLKSATRKIYGQYLTFRHLSDRDGKHQYINRCRFIPTCGRVFFRTLLATPDSSKRVAKRKIGIGMDGVMILDHKTNYIIYHWPFSVIDEFTFTEKVIVLRVNYGGIINEYMFASKYSKALGESLGNFKEMSRQGKKINDAAPDFTIAVTCSSTPSMLMDGLLNKAGKVPNLVAFSPSDLLEYPEELARQLALLHQKLFADITRRDVLEYVWHDESPQSITRNIDHFNRFSEWVSSEVVLASDNEDRTETLKQLITLAAMCHKYNNFNGLMGVLAGLNSTPVRKLKAAWSALPRLYVDEFNNLESIMDASHNFARYRSALGERENATRLVFTGILMSDLQFHVDGNSDTTVAGQINFAKRSRFVSILQEAERGKRKPYFLAEISDVTDFLLNVLPMTTDAQYEIARTITEGSNKTKSPGISRTATILRSIGAGSRRTMSVMRMSRGSSNDKVAEK